MSDITGGGRNARTPKKTDGDITPAGKRKAGVLSDSFETLTKRRGGAKPGVKKEGDAQGPSATTAEGNGTSRIEVLIRADKISKAEVGRFLPCGRVILIGMALNSKQTRPTRTTPLSEGLDCTIHTEDGSSR